MLPLLSRMASGNWQGLSVLYVCPLRALLNNLEPRLTPMAGWLGRRVALWHGDVAESAKRRLAADPPDILLTTPESLEAMLISGRVDQSWVFANLRAVVVDELHAFAGDDRGWHLLGVLARLTRLAGHPVQRIGLSATIGNPDSLLDWLSDDAASPRTVVNPPTDGGPPTEVQLDHPGSLRTPQSSSPGCTRDPNGWCSAIRGRRLSSSRSHCAATASRRGSRIPRYRPTRGGRPRQRSLRRPTA